MKINLKCYYRHTLNRFRFIFLATIAITLVIVSCGSSLQQPEVIKPTEYQMNVEYNLPNPSFLTMNQMMWVKVRINSTLKLVNYSNDTIKLNLKSFKLGKIMLGHDTIYSRSKKNYIYVLPVDSVFIDFIFDLRDSVKVTSSSTRYFDELESLRKMYSKFHTLLITDQVSPFGLPTRRIVTHDYEFESNVRRASW